MGNFFWENRKRAGRRKQELSDKMRPCRQNKLLTHPRARPAPRKARSMVNEASLNPETLQASLSPSSSHPWTRWQRRRHSEASGSRFSRGRGDHVRIRQIIIPLVTSRVAAHKNNRIGLSYPSRFCRTASVEPSFDGPRATLTFLGVSPRGKRTRK
ncbi:hypothetical protein BDN72DRAFT_831577 [Pluteus cervinus]|uniref:Uncharacterized protein n=1 Tax=Pluteus cervinus TaxID=181527 RepID=A0ACD3BEV0_9AGAR|nr:hypothetical protein BDN72DRAFT_831577 [Pluteus cervinus]